MAPFSWYDEATDNADKKVTEIVLAGIQHIGSDSRIEQAALTLDRLASLKQHGGSNSAREVWKWWLQDEILHIASLVPHDSPAQDNLITLMFTLRSLPNRPNSSHCPEWTSLFQSNMQVCENFDGGDGIGIGLQETGDAHDQAFQHMRYRNFNAFGARLDKVSLVWVDVHSLWCFRLAFEEPGYGSANPETLSDSAPPSLAINVALDWIMIAGKQLFSHAVDDVEQQQTKGGNLWKGPHGFNTARWDFWAHRLDEINLDETLDLSTRARAVSGAMMIRAMNDGK